MHASFLPGIEVLAKFKKSWLKGRRIGLVSHPAAVGSQGAPSFQVLLNAGAHLTALFGPEHGFFGTETAGEPVKNKIHPQLGIPVYSLYGEAPRGTCLGGADRQSRKPRGSLLRRSNASGCEGWIFAEPCEAKNAISPRGNLPVRRGGLSAVARLQAGPQGFAYSAVVKPLATKAGLAKKGKYRRPTPSMLSNIDTIVFDLQDLGARPYTYVSTLRYILEAAAQEKKEVIVTDRPIPLPRIIDGPMLDDKFSSFVGCVPAPMHYGMTPGEISLWLKQSLSLDLDLTVVPMHGYFRQSMRGKNWPPWIPPSPGIRSWETGYCYLATVFAEALPAINIGRNSNLAFQVFSAPNIKGHVLCKHLNRQHLPGVVFYPHPYKVAGENKIYDGARIAVCNPDCFHPVSTSVAILAAAQNLCGFEQLWQHTGTREDFFDKLYGTDKVRLALQASEPAENIICRWQSAISAFKSIRRHFLLYKARI